MDDHAFLLRLAPMRRRLGQLRQQSLLQLDQLFARFLPPGSLAQADEGPNSRARVFTVRRTFFGFLYQALNPDCACREVVRQVQAHFALQQGGRADEGTGAYCQARADKARQLWRGLCVKVVDGTTLSLPDTPKNQRAYPQSAAQKPGCGFPLLKVVGVFSRPQARCCTTPKGTSASMS